MHWERIINRKKILGNFLLVGDVDPGNPSSLRRQTLAKWNDDKVIKWVGWIDNVGDILKKTDILCLPSYREGMPKVLLEASALGKPIVTTNIPGCKDIVELCKNGILVKPKNSKSLYEGLEKLINNKNLRKKMKFNSYKNSRKYFDVNKVVDIHLKCYEQLFSNVRQ